MNSSPLPIIVVGSSNTDLVIKSSRLPKPGETVVGGSFLMNAGGKGANQAVAAARMGGNVILVSNIGNDLFGERAIEHLHNEHIDTRFVSMDETHPSGVALILVDDNGENSISVAPGSNSALHALHVTKAFNSLSAPAIILLQLEIPFDTVLHTIRIAVEKKLTLILNPAPAHELNADVLRQIDYLTPNEHEAERLTGIAVKTIGSAQQAAEKLLQQGVKNVIVTLGSQGVFVANEKLNRHLPAPSVTALDTTGAGDCFNGALAAGLASGSSLEEAVQKACIAASLSVTRMGAQSAMPYLNELIN